VKIIDQYGQLLAELKTIIESSFLERSEITSSLALGFCGGRSIRPVFEGLLQEKDLFTEKQWGAVQFFLVDERILPVGSSESNFFQLERELLQPLSEQGLIRDEQCHPMLVENKAVDQLAGNYQRRLKENGKNFQIAFLGVGEDGHVASLFPGSFQKSQGMIEEDFLFVNDSPKPPLERISASASLLKRSGHIFLIFSGASKKQAWENFNNPEAGVEDCPAKMFHGQSNLSCLVNLG